MPRKPKPIPGQPVNQFDRFTESDSQDTQTKNTNADPSESESVSDETNDSVDTPSIEQPDQKSDPVEIDVKGLVQYREELKKKLAAKAISNEEKYPQQNVGIDRNLVAAIESLLKSNNKKGKTRKLTKKGIYNDALRMYLEIAFGEKVPSVEE